MALTSKLKIYKQGSQILKAVCKPVEFPISITVENDIQHMKRCFKNALEVIPTLGLAAPQVGILSRIFICPKDFQFLLYKSSPRMMKRKLKDFEVFINPKILEMSKQEEFQIESCLSLENSYAVKRSKQVRVQYFSKEGERKQILIQATLARLFQHELDHLDGITIKDRGIQQSIYNAEQKQKQALT